MGEGKHSYSGEIVINQKYATYCANLEFLLCLIDCTRLLEANRYCSAAEIALQTRKRASILNILSGSMTGKCWPGWVLHLLPRATVHLKSTRAYQVNLIHSCRV